MAVMFIQYLMPDGRQQPQWITLPASVEERADLITKAGFQFEMEMLSDYVTCSFTIADPHTEEDVAGPKLATNGPDVLTAITSLIMDFRHERLRLTRIIERAKRADLNFIRRPHFEGAECEGEDC